MLPEVALDQQSPGINVFLLLRALMVYFVWEMGESDSNLSWPCRIHMLNHIDVILK